MCWKDTWSPMPWLRLKSLKWHLGLLRKQVAVSKALVLACGTGSSNVNTKLQNPTGKDNRQCVESKKKSLSHDVDEDDCYVDGDDVENDDNDDDDDGGHCDDEDEDEHDDDDGGYIVAARETRRRRERETAG